MAKKTEEQNKIVTDQDLIGSFLKNNKEDHFNFLEERYYKISTGSLILDSILDGGLSPGLHRFIGQNSGGKSSEAMEVTRNFLKKLPKSKGVYFPTEGRLDKDARAKSKIKFVYDPKDWDFGTVFVYESNIYESVAQFIQMLIQQDTETFYIMVLDSVDGLVLKNDQNKPFEESAKVAGGAVIASVLMKRIAIPLAKRGHMAIFTSQVRSDVIIDPYAPKTVRQTSATGGNALLHYANVILQFEPRYKDDMILDNDKQPPSVSNPPKGHWAKVIIKKSSNDKNNYLVKYPIKYRTGEETSGIWAEKEVVDCLLQWEDIEKKGAWFCFSQDLKEKVSELLESDDALILDSQYQGMANLFDAFEKAPKFTKVLFNYLSQNILNSYVALSEEPNEAT
jgi:RecA/RadA recombinase